MKCFLSKRAEDISCGPPFYLGTESFVLVFHLFVHTEHVGDILQEYIASSTYMYMQYIFRDTQTSDRFP